MTSVDDMNARNELARDVLTEVAVDDRGRLATVALKTVPDNVAYIDWMKEVFTLSNAAILDLQNDNVEDVFFVKNSFHQSIDRS